MISVMCIVQQGQLSNDSKVALKSDIRDFSFRSFSKDADIDWIEIPEGSGFTAALPSKALIISANSDSKLATEERNRLLRELCDIGMQHSNLSPHDIVVSVRDPQQ